VKIKSEGVQPGLEVVAILVCLSLVAPELGLIVQKHRLCSLACALRVLVAEGSSGKRRLPLLASKHEVSSYKGAITEPLGLP
jgi:hypothetical protein